MVLRLFGAKIGKGCIVYSSAKIWYPKNLILGESLHWPSCRYLYSRQDYHWRLGNYITSSIPVCSKP